MYAVQKLIYIHGVQQLLVETCLEFIRYNQYFVFGFLECPAYCIVFYALPVEGFLCIFGSVYLNRARQCTQCLYPAIVFLLYDFVDNAFVSNNCFARFGYEHSFCLASYVVDCLFHKMGHYKFGLFAHGLGFASQLFHYQANSLFLFIFFRIQICGNVAVAIFRSNKTAYIFVGCLFYIFEQCLVCGVVQKNIKDELFVDSLTHRVQVVGFHAGSVVFFPAEKLICLVLWRSCEREETDVRHLLACRLYICEYCVNGIVAFGFALLNHAFYFIVCRKCVHYILCALASDCRVRFVNNYCVCALFFAFKFCKRIAELLNRAYYYLSALVDCIGKIL